MNETEEKQTTPAPVYGLIAAGGHSVRMGREKGGLRYGPRSQVRRMYELVEPYCPRTFVSVRPEQSDRDWYRALPQVHDLFRDLGPVSGLLSAMVRHPDVAWLFVACDMPFVTGQSIRRLLRYRNPERRATVFRHPGEALFEPVLGVYEPDFRETIEEELSRGTSSLQRMLGEERVATVLPSHSEILTSVDRPFEFERAKHLLRGNAHV